MEQLIKCPQCSPDKSPKMYINTEKKQFICFRCHNFMGPLGRLLAEYPAIAADIDAEVAKEATVRYRRFKLTPRTIDILDELNPVVSITPEDPHYQYLISRGWTESMIEEYSPLRSVNKDQTAWVVIPIYDENETIKYFVGRDITETMPTKYKNCTAPKAGVLFESHVGESVLFQGDAVVCEGIFDSAKVPNAVALLGKTLSSGQKDAIYTRLSKANNVFVALDSGAEIEMENIANTISTWWPFKNVYTFNTTAYGDKDLGDLSKTYSSIQLMNFIKSHSIKLQRPDSIRNKLGSFKR